jgi:hypothetical protein
VTSAASLSGSAALSATGTAGPDPAALWEVYQQLTAAAQVAGDRWCAQRQAGGSGLTSGLLYGAAYEAERQASLAYNAFLAAQRAAKPGSSG